MNVLARPHMNVEQFLDWAVGRPGRYELVRGEVFAMSPETANHAEIKGAIYTELKDAIRRQRLPCHVLPDGMTIRIDDTTAYEPDAQVYCGEKLKGDALLVPNPVIVAEVLSPSTRRVDVSVKLAGYFRLPSLAHYLIIDLTQPSIIHHARADGGTILTRVFTEGRITLDPPGLELDIAQIYQRS